MTLTKAQRSTPAGQELVALLLDLSDDGMVSRDEMERLRAWLEVDRGIDLPACAFLYEVVDTIAADGEITEDELDQLALAIERVLPKDVRGRAREQRKLRRLALQRERAVARETARTSARAASLAERERTRVLHRGDFIVAGTSRSAERREACELLEVDETVVLEREPDNRHDRNAILVLADNGDQLGYVPRTDASEMAPLLDQGCFVEARVKKLLETQSGRTLPVVVSTIRREPPGEHLQRGTPSAASAAPVTDAPQKTARGDDDAPPGRSGCLTAVVAVLIGSLAAIALLLAGV